MRSLLRPPRVLLGVCWLSIATWGFALGAKVFDLVVLGTAWAADLPRSLALMPYGQAYPIDPGDFFQPLSVLLLLASAGALIAGWRYPKHVRRRLWQPLIALAIIWVLTPLVFWPMINGLWEAGHGRGTLTHAEVVQLAHDWFAWDGLRIALIGTGFVTQAGALMALVRTWAAPGEGSDPRP